jgi:nuclear protein localization family protein 4
MLRERLQKEHNADFQRSHDSFSMDAGGKVILRDNQSILEAGLKNGDMIYTLVDDGKVGIHEASTLKKAITKDGRIVAQHADQAIQASGFRPGMLPLRSMKMNWTLDEFIRLDEQFVYKIKAQEKSNCSTLSVNADSLQNFQSYMRSYDYRVIR